MIKRNEHGFWSCLALISLIMAIVTGHQMLNEKR